MIQRSTTQIEQIKNDLEKKIVFLSGPRQVGKTTLAKSLEKQMEYLNYDILEDRGKILRQDWDWSKKLIILDELHKKPKWKSFLKGLYDQDPRKNHFLVTGSAKLNTYKKVGDSLAGRFFEHRLHPFDLKELKGHGDSQKNFKKLLIRGGFPEAFTATSDIGAARFRRAHLDIILRQDLIDIETVKNISGIETLIALLRERVGSGISFSSLARDIGVDPKTVKNWIRILEDLYVVFTVTPHTAKIARSILKEPKVYFFDNGQIPQEEGPKFENLVALALLKEIHLMEDLYGVAGGLHYLRNKEKKEVDFIVTFNRRPYLLIEAKNSDPNVSSGLSYFHQFFKAQQKNISPYFRSVQIVADSDSSSKSKLGIEVMPAVHFLENLDFRPFVT